MISKNKTWLGLASFAVIIGAMIVGVPVSAGSDVIDHVLISVPSSCTLSGTGMNSHNATINSGQYDSEVGETTLKAVCNDQNGFAIYATGYTDNIDGKNVLTNSALDSSHDIVTGTGITGNSQWAMKLSVVTSPTPNYPIGIQNGFNAFHVVPDDYTLVAKRESATDSGENPEGSILKTTYQVYVSTNQAPGAYAGQVKYTLVHPHSHPIPSGTMLDTGQVVAAKIKTLAAGTAKAYNANTTDIKSIRMADSLPAGFVASEANTVSTVASQHPIYIFFDNADNAGIMYFYSDGYQVIMNPDSAHMFRGNVALSDISGVASWDASNVTTMATLFTDSVILLNNLDALSNWDVSNVQNMAGTFGINASAYGLGYTPQLSNLSGLLSWDTGNVTTMQAIFQNNTALTSLHGLEMWDVSNLESLHSAFAGTGITNVDALASWDVSNVTTIQGAFMIGATMYNTYGVRSHLTDISGLSNWNTSSVTDMKYLFQHADKITSVAALSGWNVSSVTEMTSMFLDAASLASLSSLAGWNVSSVTNMDSMFERTTSLTNLQGLGSWNVANVTSMGKLFYYASALTDATAVNDWDVRKVTVVANEDSGKGFGRMFGNVSVHPVFSLRAGSWNSNGTFTPSS